MGLPTSDCQRGSDGATGALPGGRNKVRRIGGEGAPAALRVDYGGQRERSRIARAAVPCCTAPDGPSCRSSANTGRQVVLCVRPLWWTASCPRRGRRRGEHISDSRPARTDWRPCSGRPAALLRRPFGAPVSCPRGSSSPRSTSARVGAFRTLRPTPLRLPSRLSADHQTAREQPRHR